MYSEQLESIIDAALADGVLTDKEREVLHKRAAQEGVDPDELEVVIEGRLAKKKKEEDWLRPTPPNPQLVSNKIGKVLKCPKCGADYVQGSVKCPECGHEFVNREAVSSSVQFAIGIEKCEDRSELVNYIINYPIPNTKDDLIEFILAMDARKKGDFYAQTQDAYRSKLLEAINKAKAFFPNDPQLSPLIKKYSRLSWSNLSSYTRVVIIYLIFLILFFSFLGLMAYLENLGYV